MYELKTPLLQNNSNNENEQNLSQISKNFGN